MARTIVALLLLLVLLPSCQALEPNSLEQIAAPSPEATPSPSPVPTLTEEPTVAPATDEPSEEPSPDVAPETDYPEPETDPPELETNSPEPENPKNDAYFDSAVFIGDSVMEGIRQYVARSRKEEAMLGEARFVTTTNGLAIADVVGDWDRGLMFSYKGVEAPLSDIVSGMGAERFILLFGLNDLSADLKPSVPDVIDRYMRMIAMIREASQGAEIIVLASTPKTVSNWLPPYVLNNGFDNELISSFVDGLAAMCQSEGIGYIDIHSVLMDESGALPAEYSRDDFVHLNDAGAKIVVDMLYDYASRG
ncbi:MAG: GDSL-type esterase/lipase family protein [Clostridiales bacterium]|jgi:lysophospholipase L1-like esterase|nr:GDSL-type esterase/lipase family protein [Clostridiales bacterium]